MKIAAFLLMSFCLVGQAAEDNYTRDELEGFSKETLIEIVLVLQSRNVGPVELFTPADADECRKFNTYESERICLKNRVEASVAAECIKFNTYESERACLSGNARYGRNTRRSMLPEDFAACRALNTYESERACLVSKTPAALTEACVKFNTYESERECLRAN